MAIPLHRQLLYNPKSKLDKFGLPEDVQDKLYELYVTTKEGPIGSHYTAVDVFNEVFYLLTDIYDNPSAAEQVGEYLHSDLCIFPNRDPEIDGVSGYPKTNAEYEQYQIDSSLYVFSFVWLILEINAYKPKHVKFFLVALDKQIKEKNPYFEAFSQYKNKNKLQLEMDFSPCPDVFISASTEEWVEETGEFQKDIITTIVHRYRNQALRKIIVGYMRNAYDEVKNQPASTGLPWEKISDNIGDESFWDKLLQDCENEDIKKEEEALSIQKSKDERIAELEAQIKDLKREKNDAIEDKRQAERERDKYRRKLEELTSRFNRKHIPAELKSEEAQLILSHLMRKDIISPLGYDTYGNTDIQCYRWDGTGALFGYFVDKMNFQLELADSGGRLNWKIFKMAFANYEEKEKRARDTVSFYKMHQEAKMPENAEKIDDAIAYAEKIINEKKNQPQPPKIKLG